ncbi:site-specific DNA-methyltransferase [Notoacmeibacter sp. MSK16QG-6]|uniref:DNA-methyltransferase n=1 Tax=Notoacmeibacter sp. MSK16QG-6 TaxID=2957982 RepID=UPI0020A08426|nr:site-specific DNA-methyltransferase [Notoacmeibacter sp. MSK16QG-6]MCP1200079.1 site-specific DNA-methyltransferase [Notoacmeibacter sp. MSK16QG-6]
MSVETFLDGRVTMHIADVFDALDAMEPDSVDCVVTSPPYWGLRDYGVEGQIGLEPTLGEHLDVMVRVFAAVRRVLKPTGTLWINYGDCYATAPNGRSAAETKSAGTDDRTFRDKPFSTVGAIYHPNYEKTSRVGTSNNKGSVAAAHGGRVVAGGGLKPKDLCMVPNRLAIALQEAGWWVRAEIVWGKSNPMPDSSGTSRPSGAHEKIFMLTKSGDGDVWRARDTGEISFAPDLSERCPLVTDETRNGPRWMRIGAYYDAEAVRQSLQPASVARLSQDIGRQAGSSRANGGRKTNGRMKAVGKVDKQHGHSRRHAGFNDRWDAMTKQQQQANGRLLRNYEPAPLTVWPIATMPFSEAHFATFPPDLAERCILAGCPKGGLVLDPFGGAGTTALVALRFGRLASLVELNPDYAALARRRVEADWKAARPFTRKQAAAVATDQISIFDEVAS